jgi:predicted nucleotide-binding protein (sugar kinase/HSP70/actin superfamily)
MKKKVGIPRALFYYKYHMLWKRFLEELGAEVVPSGFTNKKILNDGVSICTDEACLPVKVFCGHAAALAEKVDYLFIPRLTSISRGEYVCPELGGLPDIIRHTIKNPPPIIDVEVNLRKSGRNSFHAAKEVAGYFTNDKGLVKKAYSKAVDEYRHSKISMPAINSEELNIAVIGHPYNLYDNCLNMNMLDKLKRMGANPITVEMIKEDAINLEASHFEKKPFWYFARKALGGTLYLMEEGQLDGIIYVMSYGCGVDSFVHDFLERRVRDFGNIPYILITLDEHSGEAGLNTRLEAFIDMIRWKNKDENNIPASW